MARMVLLIDESEDTPPELSVYLVKDLDKFMPAAKNYFEFLYPMWIKPISPITELNLHKVIIERIS